MLSNRIMLTTGDGLENMRALLTGLLKYSEGEEREAIEADLRTLDAAAERTPGPVEHHPLRCWCHRHSEREEFRVLTGLPPVSEVEVPGTPITSAEPPEERTRPPAAVAQGITLKKVEGLRAWLSSRTPRRGRNEWRTGMTQLIAQPDDIQAMARAFRAAEQRVREARSRFAAAAHVAQAMGRDDLASNYNEAHGSMTKALDQLIESFSNGVLQFEGVAAVYTNTDQTLGKDFAGTFDSTVDGLPRHLKD